MDCARKNTDFQREIKHQVVFQVKKRKNCTLNHDEYFHDAYTYDIQPNKSASRKHPIERTLSYRLLISFRWQWIWWWWIANETENRQTRKRRKSRNQPVRFSPPTISSSSNISGSEINRTRLRQTPVTKPAFLRILSVSQFSPISIIKNTCVHTEFEDPKNYLHSFIDWLHSILLTSMHPHLSAYIRDSNINLKYKIYKII